MTERAAITLGVLVPCRNEQRVIARRLANLLGSVWPESAGVHKLLVVDDGSDDETARIAAETMEAETSGVVSCELIENVHAPGKNGAIQTGLERLGEEVDVVVLTDADVVTDLGALEAIAAAFEQEPQLGMVSGVQSLHSSLPRDGSVPAEETAMGLYDSWTRAVRRMESRSGRLFSVHGQLLAWRLVLRLSPRVLVADDLELMLELRRRYPSHKVRMIEGARFHEERSRERGAQDLRRARAYLQAAPLMDATTLGVQGWLYRHLPPSVPALAAFALFSACACAWAGWGLYGLGGLLSLMCLLSAHPASRRVLSLLWVIERARRAERDGSQAIRWETARA